MEKTNPEYVHALHIMVDVETTGLTPQEGEIWQLGAVALLQHTLKETGEALGTSLISEHFVYTINPSELLSNKDTVAWQKQYNQGNWEAACTLCTGYKDLLQEGLPKFIDWLKSIRGAHTNPTRNIRFWCQGTDFDFPFLEKAFKQAGVITPWGYRDKYDLRTLRNLLSASVKEKEGKITAHDALEDAKYQAERLAACLDYLGLTRGVAL